MSFDIAEAALSDGRASAKFQGIAKAQGGMRELNFAPHLRYRFAACRLRKDAAQSPAFANRPTCRDSERSSAGTGPSGARGSTVQRRHRLYTVHAESGGELAHASEYALRQPEAIEVDAS